jgi:hypothetical protein
VGVALPDKTRQTAVALKALYDEDVVDEVLLQLLHIKILTPCAPRRRPAVGRQPSVDTQAIGSL